MIRRFGSRAVLWAVAAALVSMPLATRAAPQQPSARAHTGQTALDRYVAAPIRASRGRSCAICRPRASTATLLEMTSQRWLTEQEVERPLWTHWLTVIRPAKVTSDVALLFITGGSNERQPPARPPAWLVDAARDTGTVTAELRMVPNQPVVFKDDPARKPRTEDDFIAYTWNKFLRTGDEKWPARLPMTKSAVRAMDAVTAFAASAAGGGNRVARFVVSGASKRGWTTWTTAAVDQRVIAIAPAVIDMLNVEPSFVHHYRAYGAWSDAVKDYVEQGIMDWMGTPQFRALMKIEEPYEYRERLTMPKFLRERVGRSVLPARLVALLFRRAAGREPPALRAERVALARQDRRARERAGVLRVDRQGHAAPEIKWTFETRRLDQGGAEGAAGRGAAVAGDQPRRRAISARTPSATPTRARALTPSRVRTPGSRA